MIVPKFHSHARLHVPGNTEPWNFHAMQRTGRAAITRRYRGPHAPFALAFTFVRLRPLRMGTHGQADDHPRNGRGVIAASSSLRTVRGGLEIHQPDRSISA